MRMNECEHYTIRGDVAKHRERDPRVNYPFTLPQELMRGQEQIKSLLPTMDSQKHKRWDCKLCLREYLAQDCPHDQLTIEAAGSVALANADVVQDTRTNNATAKKIDALDVLICAGLKNAEVECITKKYQNEPRVYFDLNEPCDEAFENNNNVPVTEELVAVDNAECCVTELVPLDEQQTKNLVDPAPEASSQVPNNDIGKSNVSPSLDILEADISDNDDLIPSRKKTSCIKKARKYQSVSYLIREGKREGSQKVPSSDSQRKRIGLQKKKLQDVVIQEHQVGPKISKGTEDASRKTIKNRTFDFVLPLEQNCQLAGVSPSPRRASSGKRKHQENHDQNCNSDAIAPYSSVGLQNEARSVRLKKRRIFCIVERTHLANADQSPQVESDADQSLRAKPDTDQSRKVEQEGVNVKSKVIIKRRANHTNDKNDASSARKKERLSSPVGDHANSCPTRIKKATCKVAHHLMLGSKLRNKHCRESSSIASDKKIPDKSAPVVAEKELVSRDEPISTIANDGLMPCLENDHCMLSQLKSEIINRRMLSRGVSPKRLKVDLPPANKKQRVNRIGENGTSSLNQPEKSDVREVTKRGRPRKVIMSGASSSGSKKKGGNEQPAATVEKELVLREGTVLSPVSLSEAALQLLSTVAVEHLEFDGLTDCTFLPIAEKFHDPPIRNLLEMGYAGCIEVTNPADHFLVDGEGDRFKLGPEDLPLRPHRLLPAKIAVPIASPTVAATRLAVPADYSSQWH